jgi:hypothetical protein
LVTIEILTGVERRRTPTLRQPLISAANHQVRSEAHIRDAPGGLFAFYATRSAIRTNGWTEMTDVNVVEKDERAPIERAAFTIAEFCARHNFSKAKYHGMKNAGLGPDEMRINGLIRITREAELAWQRARTNPQGAELKRRERAEAVAVARGRNAGRLAVESPRHISKQGVRCRARQKVEA